MLRVVLVGMGPLGCAMAGYFNGKRSLVLAGAVDADPEKKGKNVGDLSGRDDFKHLFVESDIPSALERAGADAVILATVSSLEELIPQVEAVAPYKADIVSTCEELSYPWITQPENAGKIDAIAKQNGITVLGTGVNPGFLMDYLPSVMTGICRDITSVRVSRIQDASLRRVSFKKKIGAGLNLDEFAALKDEGALRHVGLAESVHMLAAGAGWVLDCMEETIEPVIADSDFKIEEGVIKRGMALGVEQRASGFSGGREVINLLFRAAIGEKEPHDSIEIGGVPSFISTVRGGINGDIATCAVTTNALKSAKAAPAGLKTMIDVPVVTFSP